MDCPKCQLENREGAIFCWKCGWSVNTEIACPGCDSSNPPDSNFCEKCGQNLKSPNKFSSTDYYKPQAYTPKHLTDKILTTRSSIEGECKGTSQIYAGATAAKNDKSKVNSVEKAILAGIKIFG